MTTPQNSKKLIEQHQRHLQILKERQAVYGINTPPEVQIEIEDIEVELKKLSGSLAAEQTQLQQALQNTASLPVAEQIRQLIEPQLAEIAQRLQTIAAAPTTMFDQRGQQVAQQINVAGDLVQQAAPPPAANPAELRRSYLHRLVQQTRRLPLDALDPKATHDADRRELQLAAVYTAFTMA